jgi:hypothetical protein
VIYIFLCWLIPCEGNKFFTFRPYIFIAIVGFLGVTFMLHKEGDKQYTITQYGNNGVVLNQWVCKGYPTSYNSGVTVFKTLENERVKVSGTLKIERVKNE